ncbi:hypothetical protein ONZ43_g1165 [Nemania bipapillata]|uniref:Uncharacterized protein n=1 Tax=Nemania bipapillata TaxID=110536 RepID=A0ACC2J5F9_9PEZI|nr:hypothetical protein ONZ43_g1165 [Nemania bipapillata]
MPAKNKGGVSKAKETEAKQQVSAQQPQTVRELEWQRYWSTNPLHEIVEKQGLAKLSPTDKRAYLNLELARSPGQIDKLSKKGQRELWKQLSEANIPLRSAPRPRDDQWGHDNAGRDIGDYTPEEYAAYEQKKSRLSELRLDSAFFKRDRERAYWKTKNEVTGEVYTITEDDIRAEKARRQEMASLYRGLGNKIHSSYENDPEWDDVVPIPQEEPEGALSAIAYEEDYAEAMAYLRAVMAAKEYSLRCLQLTETIIDMNPAHYTVWLYRFDIIKALKIPIRDELEWLNDVSFQHLKNYQIWHHRQQLIDLLHLTPGENKFNKRELARDEHNFIMQMLSKDTKNYHVWSYRQYLVRKLDLWTSDDEISCIDLMLSQDVRNNSAWSHRFFIIFSNPDLTTFGALATDPDSIINESIIDREIKYAQKMIEIAPQNQSPWNYLRGVLVKAGLPLGHVRDFAESFCSPLVKLDEQEEVRSSHALDFLVDIYNDADEKEKSIYLLRRLSEKWDPIRKGYWTYRQRMLQPQQS